MNSKTKQLVTAGMICAMAFVLVSLINIPIIPGVEFLKYEPKDIIITIGGFVLGPWAVLMSSVVVSFIELFTISNTGIIGFIMNILSTCGFSLPAAIIYKKKHSLSGAIIGLAVGTVAMTALMILWNYLITPLYMDIPREQIVPMLTTIFTPFNLLKGIINSAAILLLYKPLITALRKAKLVEKKESTEKSRKNGLVALLIGAFVLATSILVILVINGVI